MAEYWKSAPRHWCKQCKIFIRDTPFEKTQHEASGKHQSALKRFLREIHKDNEIKTRESQRAKSEVERLRQSVAGSGGDSKAGAPSRSAVPTPPTARKQPDRPVSIEERKKQMAQLADMGIAVPQEYRADMAVAGDWQTMSETKIDDESAKLSVGVRKRKLEGQEEEEEDEHAPEPFVSKGWGSRMRVYPGAQEEREEDLDALLASTKDIKKTKTTAETEKPANDAAGPDKKGDGEAHADAQVLVQAKTPGGSEIVEQKTEEEEVKGEETAPVFKKRKPKVMRR
ncbi:Zinc finger U1-type [Penicillium riverlandense]|uniref:Zinc finger U1-type n=1 Tax=Penicillium riverlandense TaxID=1903569 RepID=UPI0025485BFF|nr:Zinc finger U1-type [Penicillium riverlandense]KAJ5814971.1 Zinc finger U1-type [Penicillium riverlandense]